LTFALDPSDFAPYGVTNNNTPPTCALDSSGVQVHDIFRYQNFTRPHRYGHLHDELRINTDTYYDLEIVNEPLSQSTYNRCLPAFRLASLFLRRSAYFYHCVRNSPVWSTTGLHNRGKRYLRRKDPSQFTDTDRTEIKGQMNALANRLTLIDRLDETIDNCSALSHLADDYSEAGPTEVRYFGSIKRNLERIATANFPFFHHSTQLRLLFALAVDLVHELCHLLYWERFLHLTYSPPNGHQLDRDPYFDLSHPQKELGHAWEYYFFGMKLMIGLWSEDWLIDLFTNTPGLGHQKPLYPAVFRAWKHRRAYTVTPFKGPDRHQVKLRALRSSSMRTPGAHLNSTWRILQSRIIHYRYRSYHRSLKYL
jgi:hypothetical protein